MPARRADAMSDRRLRVLLVTDSMASRGGAETYVSTIREALLRAGTDVRLLTTNTGVTPNPPAEFVARGSERRAAQAILQIANPFALAAARAAARSFRPDVALVHLFAYHLSPAVLWGLARVPIVLTVHDYKIVCPLGSKLLPGGQICTDGAGLRCWRSGCVTLPHLLRDEVRYAAIRAALGRVRRVLACSHHVQHELAANGISSEVLALPVKSPDPGFIRTPAPHPLFVFSGRFSREKGLPGLLRAFARVHARQSPARLRILGDGGLRGELEQQAAALGIADAVTFTGWLDASQVEQQLSDTWALVAPALWAEPFGLVAPEAIVRGVPVIASRVGGFAESVEDGRSGLLFDNGDEQALYRCLEAVASGAAFSSHVLPPDVVERARTTYSVDVHVEKLHGHIEAVRRH